MNHDTTLHDAFNLTAAQRLYPLEYQRATEIAAGTRDWLGPRKPDCASVRALDGRRMFILWNRVPVSDEHLVATIVPLAPGLGEVRELLDALAWPVLPSEVDQ